MTRRTATQLLELRGAFKQNPQRRRPHEPTPSKAFRRTAPRHLTAEQRRCWKEIVDQTPAGVLTGSDALLVELTALLLAELRADFAAMPTTRVTQLRLNLGLLGMTPSGRASLTVEKPKRSDFDDV